MFNTMTGNIVRFHNYINKERKLDELVEVRTTAYWCGDNTFVVHISNIRKV